MLPSAGSAHAFPRSARRAGTRPHWRTPRTPSRSAPASCLEAAPPVHAYARRCARAGRSPTGHARARASASRLQATSALTICGRAALSCTSISGRDPPRVCVTASATGDLPITRTRRQMPSSNRSTTLCGRRRRAHTVRSSLNGGRALSVNVSSGTCGSRLRYSISLSGIFCCCVEEAGLLLGVFEVVLAAV